MAIVEFRGAMLFVGEAGYLREVVFPDTGSTPPGGGTDKKHVDGSAAVKHYPGLVHVGLDKSEKHYDLTGSILTFLGGTTHIPLTEISGLPDMGTAIPSQPLAFDQMAARSATISMIVPPHSCLKLCHPEQKFFLSPAGTDCPLTVQLTFEGEITLIVTDATAFSVIRVRTGERAVVHNFDTRAPLYENLTAEHTIDSATTTLPDEDFKWLYGLCQPQPGSEKWNGGALSTPVWKRDTGASSPVVVSVSTCFPARIGS